MTLRNPYHLLAFIFFSLLSHQTAAGPWFTGPLLAPSGHIIPKGHTNFEPYAVYVEADGHYDDSGHIVHTPLFRTAVANPILSHGFTDWLDLFINVPYVVNMTKGAEYHRLGDVIAGFGIQLLEQNNRPNRIDLRFLYQETIPTGHYELLNARFSGTDATGLGAYQSQFGLNLQYLNEIFPTHYLRTRVILSRLYTNPVEVHGLNSYGGTPTTDGTIQVGSENDLDVAFEYTLTQNWVAVMEGYISRGDATRFNGILGIQGLGGPTAATIGSNQYSEVAFAPAIEYNFNGNVGLIGGVWFPVYGTNTGHYLTYLLALNAYW